MTRRSLRRLAALAALLASACHAPVTQLVVVVDSTLPAGALDELRVEVVRPSDLDASMVIPAGDVALGHGGDALPQTLTLVPDGVVSGTLSVRVTGLLGGASVVEREVHVEFRPGESHMVPVLLRAQCAGIECDTGSTCGENGCRAPELASPPSWPGCAPWTTSCGGDDDAAVGGFACATDLRSRADHCGSCTVACGGDAGCTMGFCMDAVVVDVAAGGAHSCAVRATGNVACWGRNDAGQLGTGSSAASTNHAVPVPGLHNAVRVVAGASHTCVLTRGGTVYCWGSNVHGQLGDGLVSSRATPGMVAGLPGRVSHVAAGGDQTCAIVSRDPTVAGTLYCWGDDSHGQMQDPARIPVTAPRAMALPGGVGALDVAVGSEHVCAIDAGGAVRCWGADSSGQLGDRPTASPPADQLAAVTVQGLAGAATALSAGAAHTCAVVDGQVQCWGNNDQKQLGRADPTSPSLAPTTLFARGDALRVAAGGTHTCALFADHTARCWGSNATLQLGDGSRQSQPSADPTPLAYGGHDLEALVAGDSHGCARRSYGGVVCWGANESGEVGDSSTTPRSHPALVTGLP